MWYRVSIRFFNYRRALVKERAEKIAAKNRIKNFKVVPRYKVHFQKEVNGIMRQILSFLVRF